MPSVSKAQQRLMCGTCRRPQSMKAKVSRKVACEYCGAGLKEGAPERKDGGEKRGLEHISARG